MSLDEHFPFFNLPIELRNMIYGYYLEPLYLRYTTLCLGQRPRHASRPRRPVGDILCVNRQVLEEASIVLYALAKADIPIWARVRSYSPSHPFFKIEKSSGGVRSLRSGRRPNTTTFRGVIYPHILKRFSSLEIRTSYGSPWYDEHNAHERLAVPDVLNIIEVLYEQSKDDLQPNSKTFSLTIEPSQLLDTGLGYTVCIAPPTDTVPTWLQEGGLLDALKTLTKVRKVTIGGKGMTPACLQRLNDEVRNG